MSKPLDNYLSLALKRLEKAADAILKTQGYNRETEKVKALQELVKEQIREENPSTSARSAG